MTLTNTELIVLLNLNKNDSSFIFNDGTILNKNKLIKIISKIKETKNEDSDYEENPANEIAESEKTDYSS